MSDPRAFFKPGAVVYFKKCLRRPTSKSDWVAAKVGYNFGVLLGSVAPHTPDPTPNIIAKMMSGSGYVSFDDVIEMLGQERFAELLKKMELKYCPQGQALPQAPKLLDANGKPLSTVLADPPKDIQ